MPAETYRGTATGFVGLANNCDADDDRGEMVTTDNSDRIQVHDLSTLSGSTNAPVRTYTCPACDFDFITGVCVAHQSGNHIAVVSDETDDMVIMMNLLTGAFIRQWSHGMNKAEGVACDDDNQRIVICDDAVDTYGCEVYTYNGSYVGAFGVGYMTTDSEGVALYRCGASAGYWVVSDQSSDEYEIFDRNPPFAHYECYDVGSPPSCSGPTYNTGCFELRDGGPGGDLTNDDDGIDIFQGTAYPYGIFGACDGCGSGHPVGQDEFDLAPWAGIAQECTGVIQCLWNMP
jgi:hypothetical protein